MNRMYVRTDPSLSFFLSFFISADGNSPWHPDTADHTTTSAILRKPFRTRMILTVGLASRFQTHPTPCVSLVLRPFLHPPMHHFLCLRALGVLSDHPSPERLPKRSSKKRKRSKPSNSSSSSQVLPPPGAVEEEDIGELTKLYEQRRAEVPKETQPREFSHPSRRSFPASRLSLCLSLPLIRSRLPVLRIQRIHPDSIRRSRNPSYPRL